MHSINLVHCATKFAADCTWISHDIYTQQIVYFFCNSELSAWSHEWVLLQVNGGRMEPKPSPNQLVQYGIKCKFNSLFCKHLNMTFAYCTVSTIFVMRVFCSTIQTVPSERDETTHEAGHSLDHITSYWHTAGFAGSFPSVLEWLCAERDAVQLTLRSDWCTFIRSAMEHYRTLWWGRFSHIILRLQHFSYNKNEPDKAYEKYN
jgi:hypothetical protein